MGDERLYRARARLHVVGDNLEVLASGPLKRDEKVLVKTERGHELVTLIEDARPSESDAELPKARSLDRQDHRQLEKMSERELEALSYAKGRAEALNLTLKFVSAKLNHDGKFATLYFSAPDRVDFRALVKELAKRYSMRVEMRQIGVRDAARQVGGIGLCGRKLCCSTHLPTFKPISIRMAKDQGLALNQQKLAGACGRLRCCLQYEHDIYSKALKSMPKLHKKVTTPRGIGKVRDLNILLGTVNVLFDNGDAATYRNDEVERYIPPNQPKGTKPNEPKNKGKGAKPGPSKPSNHPSSQKAKHEGTEPGQARTDQPSKPQEQTLNAEASGDAPKKKRSRRRRRKRKSPAQEPGVSSE